MACECATALQDQKDQQFQRFVLDTLAHPLYEAREILTQTLAVLETESSVALYERDTVEAGVGGTTNPSASLCAAHLRH